jgi:multidrug resistance efflux pump
MADYRNVVIAFVLCLSAAGAIWLTRAAGATGVAPAQVVAQEFRISSVETGRLTAVMVAPGQRVTGGQIIARLDTAVLEREIAVAEARLRQLGSETQASAVALESEGYQNERSFQADVEDALAELESARAAQAQQAAEVKQIREELQKQRQYLKEGLVRRDRADELELRLRTLEHAVTEWPTRIESLASRHTAARARLEDWRSKYSANSAPVPKNIRVRPVRQRVDEQLEALRVLRARLGTATVVAPANGEVISVLAQPGDVVRAGEHFAVINATDVRQIVAYVNERERRVLQPGHAARLHRRTILREQYESRVVRVAETISALPTRFWISPQLAVYGREVVLEMPGNARLDPGEALDVTFASGGQS